MAVSHRGSLSFLHTAGLVRRLPSDIDSVLLRAVPLPEVLKGFGKRLSAADGTASDYELSKKVGEIDCFLSHDWGTGRWQKFLSLCYFFNLKSAVTVSCLCAVPLAWIGASSGITSKLGGLARLVCPFVYFGTFMFGRRLSSLFTTPDFVFLDKVCIHQTDDTLKAGGINGLAGFLRASRRLLVLWSPRYFSRLWCTYEIVAWCHLHGVDSSRITFLPVHWSTLHSMIVVAFAAYPVLQVPFKLYDIKNLFVLRVGTFALLAPLAWKVMTLTREVNLARFQMDGFAIRDAKCFCCTHSHRHPDTGDRMSCDRRLVYATLHDWHEQTCADSEDRCSPEASRVTATSPRSTLEEALDRFDETVRREIPGVLSNSLDSVLLCRSYTEWVSASIPLVWGCFDVVIHSWMEGRYMSGIRWLLEYSITLFFALPLCAAPVIMSIRCVETAARHLPPGCQRLLSGAVAVLVFVHIFLALWLPGSFLMSDTEDLRLADVLLLGRFVFLACLTSAVVRPRGSKRHHAVRGNPAAHIHENNEAICQQVGRSLNAAPLPELSPGSNRGQEEACLRTVPGSSCMQPPARRCDVSNVLEVESTQQVVETSMPRTISI
eukprot:TRINITY_DN21503_c0_g1_i1.p1 TRINITY_DN21503_c0_g1~~TRINITY_DN21503_c0_g1_i1.p1  ORF type:complete len:604 (-),score=38.45 TRINITY_DN21503_c0_g1_i1:144-1955(-)